MREIAWITLFFAGLLETGWALGLRYTEGFTKVGPSVATLIPPLAVAYESPPRNGVRRLDGHRGGRDGHRRDRPLRRVTERRPPPLHPPDRLGDRGAETLPGCVRRRARAEEDAVSRCLNSAHRTETVRLLCSPFGMPGERRAVSSRPGTEALGGRRPGTARRTSFEVRQSAPARGRGRRLSIRRGVNPLPAALSTARRT